MTEQPMAMQEQPMAEAVIPVKITCQKKLKVCAHDEDFPCTKPLVPVIMTSLL